MLSIGFYIFITHFSHFSSPLSRTSFSLSISNYIIKVLIHIKYKINFLCTFFSSTLLRATTPNRARCIFCSHSLNLSAGVSLDKPDAKNHWKKINVTQTQVLFLPSLLPAFNKMILTGSCIVEFYVHWLRASRFSKNNKMKNAPLMGWVYVIDSPFIVVGT